MVYQNPTPTKVLFLKTDIGRASILQQYGGFRVIAVLGGTIGNSKKVYLSGNEPDYEKLFKEINYRTDKPYLKEAEKSLIEPFNMDEINKAKEETIKKVNEEKESFTKKTQKNKHLIERKY